MKKILFIVLIAFVTTAAYAKNTRIQKCEELEDMARLVMTIRQKARSMSKVMNLVSGSGVDKELEEVLNMMVIEAFERTRYSTESLRKDMVNDYANEVFLLCIKPSDK